MKELYKNSEVVIEDLLRMRREIEDKHANKLREIQEREGKYKHLLERKA